MITELTEEQEKNLPVYRDKWLNKIFNYELYNSSNFEKTKLKIKELYKLCQLKEPIVLLMDSPIACQIAANLIENSNQIENQVGNQIGDQIWNQIRNQVVSQVRDQIWNQVRDQIVSQVRDQIVSQVGNQVEDQVGNQVRNQVWDQVGNQVKDQVWDQVDNQVVNQVLDQIGNQIRNQVGIQVGNQVKDQVENQVRDQVENQVEDQVWNQIWNQVRDQVRDQVVSQIRDQVRNQVRNQVVSQVWDQVWDQIWNQVKDQVEDQVVYQVEDQARNQVRNQVWDQVENQVVNQIWDQVSNQVRDQVGNQVGNQVSNQVRDQVWDQVSNQVRNQVRNQVEDQVEDQVDNQVGQLFKRNFQNEILNKKLSYFSFSTYINYSDFSWLSFYDFFLNQTNLLNNFKLKLEQIFSFVDNSFMSIQLEQLCIVSKYPNFISRNSRNQLHNISTAAIKFCDGYEQHYFNGIFIKPELFQKLYSKKYTFEEWTQETNEEIKSLVLAFYEEKFGGEFVFRFLSKYLTEVNSYVDKKSEEYLKNTTNGMNLGVYTLFKGKVNSIDIAYVRCYCPSTDRMFFLGVDPSINNAKDAIASLCQVPKKLKDSLVSINRQGEIFSFNFNETGTALLRSNYLTTQDFNNVVSLTGEEYFNKIKFEY